MFGRKRIATMVQLDYESLFEITRITRLFHKMEITVRMTFVSKSLHIHSSIYATIIAQYFMYGTRSTSTV